MKDKPMKASKAKASDLQINQAGIELIKSFEAFKPEKYECPAGKMTIGYGHVIKKGENFTKLTKAAAEDLLQSDMEYFEEKVRQLITVPLNSNQFSALVSFAFNAGEGNLESSTLRRILNGGDYEGVGEQLMRWTKARNKKGVLVELEGLKKRRKAEKILFESKDAAGDVV